MMNQINKLKPSKCQSRNNIIWLKDPSMIQMFSLPSSIIYYITKNPSTPKCYLQLVQSCKYFFNENPLVVASRFDGKKFCSNKRLRTCEENNQKCCFKINIKKIKTRIWLTNQLEADENGFSNTVSTLFPKLFQDVTVRFKMEKYRMEEFKLCASILHTVSFCFTQLRYDDGSLVMMDKILESIPNVRNFSYWFDREFPTATSSTFKNILKLKNLNNLESLFLLWIPEIISAKDLGDFIKKHKGIDFGFFFDNKTISEEYKLQLDHLIDDVIAWEIPNCIICYAGQDQDKALMLEMISERFNAQKDTQN